MEVTENNEETASTLNSTNEFNGSTHFNAAVNEEPDDTRLLHLYFVPPILTICVISMIINLTVIVSSFWVRRPMTPTLHLSISLAAADLYSSVFWVLCLTFFALLPVGFNIDLTLNFRSCVWMTLDVLRLTSIIVIVAHLLALAMNHYLGVMRPLSHLQILTHRTTTIIIAILWFLPHVFLIVYYSSVPGQGYQSDYCENFTFLQEKVFRITFSSFFIVPLVIMVFIYIHIYVIVRRHQARRLERISVRCSDVEDHDFRQIHRQMTRNIKAIKTTLFILGSYILGLLPAVIVFFTICKDCPVPPPQGKDLHKSFYLFLVVNVLVITKTISNPIIYATRMKEVKKSLCEMQETIFKKFRFLNPQQESNRGRSSEMSLRTQGTIVRTGTFQCKVKAIPQADHDGSVRNSSTKSSTIEIQSLNRNHTSHPEECDTEL